MHSGLIDTEEHPVLYDSTRLKLFYVLRDQRDYSKQVELTDELSRYITFNFRQVEDNWYLDHDQGRFKNTDYPAK